MGFGGGAGVKEFIALDDTPSSYAGVSQYVARVKAALDGLEFAKQVTQYNLPTNIIPDSIDLQYSGAVLGSNAIRVRVAGKYIIVAENKATGQISIGDITDVERPVLLSTWSPDNNLYDVVPVGKYLFTVSSTGDSLCIGDWSNPRSVSLVKKFTHAEILNPDGLFIRGRYCYILSYLNKTLAIFDISDPASPVFVGKLTDATMLDRAYDVVVDGNYAYCLGQPYITVVNIANPTAPVKVYQLSCTGTGSFMGRLHKVGRWLYVADTWNKRLLIIDCENPAAIHIEGDLTDTTDLASIADFSVVGNWIFTGTATGLVIIDTRDKTLPVKHSVTAMGNGKMCAVAGKYLFAANRGTTAELRVYSLWSIDIPAFVGNSIYADYIFCQNLDVMEQTVATHGIFNGVAIPDSLPKIISIPLVLSQVVITDVGTSYVELSALYRTNIDFSKLAVKQARVIVSAIGNEVGTGKGIEIYNSTDSAAICEVLWDGDTQQNGLAGSWTTCGLRAAKDIQIRVKGVSGTEDVTIDKVELQLQFE